MITNNAAVYTKTNNEAYIAAFIPGRLRIKIPALYKNSLLANDLKNFFESITGIEKVTINVYSKSILILFDFHILSAQAIIKKLNVCLTDYKHAVSENQKSVKEYAATSQNDLQTTKQISPKQLIANRNVLSNESYKNGLKNISPNYNNKSSPKNDKWHKTSITQIVDLLNTDENKGLTQEKAERIYNTIGPNEFDEKKKKSIFSMFIDEFKGFLIQILLGASVLSAFLGQIGDCITIITIVVVEAMLGVWQNYKAEKSLEELKKYSASTSKVVRDSAVKLIPSRELVPGDILQLESGDIVPADCRLIQSSNLQIDEASLTGESEPVEKSHKIEYTHSVPLADRKNMVYMGTTIVKGTCKAVVVQTGMNTEMGNIAKLIGDSKPKPTPLQKDLDKLAKTITWCCFGVCFGIMISGIIGGQPFFNMLRTGISLAIGAIPEGLTTVLAISLAFGVQRMAKKGAIVKQLPSVETLSCADVICTDKTGTLTTGQMTATDVYTLNKNYKVAGEGYCTEGDFFYNNLIINPKESKSLTKLITIGSLCNNASCTKNKKSSLNIVGDPTEGALLVLAEKSGLSTDSFSCYTRVKEFAFDSQIKKMTVICKDSSNNHTVNMKGAPDVILSKCSRILDNNEIRPITDNDIEKINSTINEMTNRALRVIGFAYKDVESSYEEHTDIEEDMIFVGLTGMIDPPRPEAKAAIRKCRKAGIKTIMITGDHKKTAQAIGNQLGLLGKNDMVVTGAELEKLSDKELLENIHNISIFARTSPHQKLRIVKALRQKGHIVVMTGDGVNDAPAIKEADIGIAMGKNGTDVTRESSSIILTDDNFTTIVKAIEEGRGISGNVKKFMRYVLSGNVGEVIAIFFTTLLGLPTPLVASQILMINLITEGIPALSLGIEPPDKNIMNDSPRDGNKSIFTKSLLRKILSRGALMGISTLGLFTSTYMLTGNLIKARTLAYANLVTNQMFHVFDCRTSKISENWKALGSVVISSGILLSSIYIPKLVGLFGTCPISFYDWIIILFMAGFIGRLDYIREMGARIAHVRKPQLAY